MLNDTKTRLLWRQGESNFADSEAKDAAECWMEKLMMVLTPPGEMQEIPVFSETDQGELLGMGANKDNEGKWRLPDGRQLLNKPLAKKC